jgi:SynChlorMet cassette protein ScmD
MGDVLVECLKSYILVQNPLVVLREESDDWAILFNPETAEAVGINPTGVVIWNMIDGRRKTEDILSEVHELFSNVPITANEEVSTFLNEIYKYGFVGYSLDN